jgi:hypothetical protein
MSVWDDERDWQNKLADRVEGVSNAEVVEKDHDAPDGREQELACPRCLRLQADIDALVRVIITLRSVEARGEGQ